MKKLILGLFLSLGVLSFSTCIPASNWGRTMFDVVIYNKGVPSQYHRGHVPKVLTRVVTRANPSNTMYITFVPVSELSKYKNNPEQLPYFTLVFKQCM